MGRGRISSWHWHLQLLPKDTVLSLLLWTDTTLQVSLLPREAENCCNSSVTVFETLLLTMLCDSKNTARERVGGWAHIPGTAVMARQAQSASPYLLKYKSQLTFVHLPVTQFILVRQGIFSGGCLHIEPSLLPAPGQLSGTCHSADFREATSDLCPTNL